MSWHEKNIEVYDRSAAELAEYFKGIGARADDIDTALALAGVGSEAKVVEIGCGDGRDAEVITQKVAWYEGVDPSSGLLELAKRKLPDVSFVQNDALNYNYPKSIDVIFAFASLLHVDKATLPKVFSLGAQALRQNGIYYVSLKERDTYAEETKQDAFGERMFYYYSPELIKELAGTAFRAVHESHQTIGSTNWYTLALQKKEL
jgi:SAM-dependent methyltransferase